MGTRVVVLIQDWEEREPNDHLAWGGGGERPSFIVGKASG